MKTLSFFIALFISFSTLAQSPYLKVEVGYLNPSGLQRAILITNPQACVIDIQVQNQGNPIEDFTLAAGRVMEYWIPASQNPQTVKARAITFCTPGAKMGWLVAHPNSATLPVKLLSFEVKGSLVTWKVAQEVDFDYYAIEKSRDGRFFFEATRVQGTGASTYRYDDPLSFNTGNFYRLKMVDRDGTVSYSKVVEGYSGNNRQMMAKVVNIYNMDGRLVTTLSRVYTDVQALRPHIKKAGTYIVEALFDDGKQEKNKIAFLF